MVYCTVYMKIVFLKSFVGGFIFKQPNTHSPTFFCDVAPFEVLSQCNIFEWIVQLDSGYWSTSSSFRFVLNRKNCNTKEKKTIWNFFRYAILILFYLCALVELKGYIISSILPFIRCVFRQSHNINIYLQGKSNVGFKVDVDFLFSFWRFLLFFFQQKFCIM